jgi:hypothetical protein
LPAHKDPEPARLIYQRLSIILVTSLPARSQS